MPQPFVITGNVVSDDGSPLTAGRVEAYDRDLPSREQQGFAPQLLGQSPLDANAQFRIEFTDEQFRRGESTTNLLRRTGKISPDLSFRVYDTIGQELTITRMHVQDREYDPYQIIFNAPSNLDEIQISV